MQKNQQTKRSRLVKGVIAASAAAICAAFFLFAVYSMPPLAQYPQRGNAEGGGQHAATVLPASGHETVVQEGSADNLGSPEGGQDAYQQRIALGDDPQSYEPGTLLLTVAEGATPESALAALVTQANLKGASIAEVVGSLVRINLPSNISVQEAVRRAETVQAVGAAQPNYRYYPTADTSGASGTGASRAQVATEALAAASAARNADALTGTSLGEALETQAAVNDPYYEKQWYLPSIKAAKAWKTLDASRVTETTVAVIDAGFRVSHEDISGAIAATYDATIETPTIKPDNEDQSEVTHGTHCLGVIAATANNGIGIAGVTRNACKVLPVRVQDAKGIIYTSYIARAYSYLVSNKDEYNIRVANISLGASAKSRVTRKTDTVLYDAIQGGRDAGILSVTSACNDSDGTPPYYAFPADFENNISVMALARTSSNTDGVARSSSSNYNVAGQMTKNISAPGSNILSLSNEKNDDEDTPYYNKRYETLSGTSMSAPVVAGVLGLMFAVNPKLTVDEATSKLYSTAKDLTKTKGASRGWDRTTGFGEANAAAAVDGSRPYLSGSSVVSVGTSKTFRVKVAGAKQKASEWKWKTSNASVATVSATGKVKGKKSGQAIISATKGSYTARQIVRVRVPAKSFKVTLSKTKFTYSGEAQGPAVTVRYGGKKLTENQDYIVSYQNNVNAGKATVIVSGVEPYYTGSVKSSFKITKAPMKTARIKLSASKLAYTGKARKPDVTVHDRGLNKKALLKRGSDYTVKGKAVVSGKGTLEITAKSTCRNFKGTATKTFRVG